MSVWFFCSFFNYVVFGVKLYELHILEINPFLVESFINIFSQSIGFLYLLFPLPCKRASHLIRSQFLIFVFIFITLGDVSKKSIATIYVKECSAYVFLKEFYNIRSYI